MKSKKHNNKKKLSRQDVTKFLALAVGAILVIMTGLHVQKLKKYEKMSSTPNQACVGVGIALENGFGLLHYDFDARNIVGGSDGVVGQYKCSIGSVVSEDVQNDDGSSDTSGYELGANVQYFKDTDDAYSYAENVVNPTRYWGIDQEGQQNNIPQTSLFTYLVTDVNEPYFDSYTVRDNAVISLALPCNADSKSTQDMVFNNCQAMAEQTLKQFAEAVNETTSKGQPF